MEIGHTKEVDPQDLINRLEGLISYFESKNNTPKKNTLTTKSFERSIQRKNGQIHLMIENNILEELKKGSKEKGISLSELCRQKLRGNDQLDRIEFMIREIIKKKCLYTKDMS